MKHTKYILLVTCLAFSFLANGQNSHLNNGRELDSNPSPKQAIEKKIASSEKESNKPHDLDDPSEQRVTPETEWTFPVDLEKMKNNILNASDTEDLQNRMDILSDQIYDLILFNEKLRLENQDIKRSLQQCCQASKDTQLSFLLQNAPNPFREDTQINYFIEGSADDALIEVRSIEGQIMGSYPINEGGYGSINLESNGLQPGYYVYTLFNNNQIIDSKVLIVVN